MSAYLSWKHGTFWVRIWRYGIRVKAPWNRPLFSERYGYTKPMIEIKGWRVFSLQQVG